MLKLRGKLVPVVYLGDLLDIEVEQREQRRARRHHHRGRRWIRIGIVVDEFCGHQQVVIKSIEESYGSVPGIAAATILGNGRVALHSGH